MNERGAAKNLRRPSPTRNATAVLFLSTARDTNDPAQPTLVPIGEATAELNTGGLRLSQPLDFDQSPGTGVGGNPALAYNSATAAPHAVVQVEMDTAADSPLADGVALTATVNGVAQAPQTFSTAGFHPGDNMVFAVELTAGATGQYCRFQLTTFAS
jgi:hypothetical protein